jgi:hypothetical protein
MKAEAKAGQTPAKKRKIVKAKPKKGFVHWDEGTFDRLVSSPPEPLASSFSVTNAMLLAVLDRPGDGFAAMRRLLTDNDEDRPAQRRHIRSAIAMYRSLLGAGVLERLDVPDELGRRVRVRAELQDDFALNQPLSLLVLEALPHLDPASPAFALDVVSVVESTLEDPRPVLAAQLDQKRSETLARLKEEGVEYDERMEVLRDLEHEKPLAELLYAVFDTYRLHHPWARDYNVAPKSVVRDMYERSMNFSEYVAHYGIARSEGLLLRYLSDAYKALVQNVPAEQKNDELTDISEWLGEIVRQVDSSLLDEWEALSHPELVEMPSAWGEPGMLGAREAPLVTANERAFSVMVRNACFRRVQLAAQRDWPALGELDEGAGWDGPQWEAAFSPYFSEHSAIGTGPDARGPALWQVDKSGRLWKVRQVIDDPEAAHDWAVLVAVDLDASDERGEPALAPLAVERLGSL